MGASRSKSTSTPVFQEFPGSFGDLETSRRKSAELSGSLENLIEDSSFLEAGYGPQTENEQALLDQLMDITASRGSVRGLGAPTQTALATSIAPTLVGLRQQDIQNRAGVRGQDINALVELISLAMPQLMGGTQSTSRSGGIKIL